MDLCIKDAHIVTGKSDGMYIGTGCIGINEGRIAYMGTAEVEADMTIDAKGMIAMPGLFNAHTHTSMILMRNYVADKSLEDWLAKSIFPIEDKLTAEYIKNASILAAGEMIKGGTVGFLDMYYHVDETAQTALETGMKANISLGILTSGEDGQDYEKAKAQSLRFHRKYNGSGEGNIRTSLEVHSVYLYDEEGLRHSADFAGNNGLMVHAHLHETRTEVENSVKNYGMRPIEVFENCGLLDVPVTAAHCVHMNDNDLAIAKERSVRPVHCPSSNLFLASGFARIPRMQELGIPIALGTDGAASNNDLDMFGEMHLAGLIHKGNSGDATVVNASSVISMATKSGARAMGFNDSGTLEVGMEADIILVDTTELHNTPMLDPVNALIYSAKASDVDTVIVRGKILMKGRELKTIDEEKARYNVNKCIEKLY